MLMAAAAFVGCSNDDEIAGSNGTSGETETNYLSVNIVPTSGATRAAGDKYDEGGDKYEDGLTTENTVDMVRFYFFDARGNASKIKYTGESYYDWEKPEVGGENHPETVEKLLAATIVIQSTVSNDADEDDNVNLLPVSIIAILNPTAEILALTNPTVDELNEVVEDYAAEANKEKDAKFVMSNSIYALNSEKMEAVSVEGHVYSTKEAAEENPVQIYVERTVAKVRMQIGLEEVDKEEADDMDETTPIYETGEEGIYVKFLGWNVTATMPQAYLMKAINPTWNMSFTWNVSDYHRSFWAGIPAEMESQYGDFYDAKLFDFGTKNYTYTQENAQENTKTGVVGAAAATTAPTQVILAAQLVNKSGKPLTVVEYAGLKVTEEAAIAALADAANVYKKTQDGGKDVYTKITPEDVKLATAMTAGAADQNKAGRYFVYIQMDKETFADGNWCIGKAENTQPAASVEEINAELVKAGRAKVWSEGYTYYYFDIRHLATSEEAPGYYGVVRNHIYDATVKTLQGLGTPVYDPEEVIYPEHPEKEDTFVGAQINILSWHIVNNNVDLVW